MSPLRPAALLSILALAAPASAFAQGAGDDQYQDPFGGDQPTQTQAQDDGLSESPPVSGAGGSSGSGSGSEGAGSEGSSSSAAPSASASAALPRTGSEPLWLALIGGSFLLIGAGLRLRTIDPDAF